MVVRWRAGVVSCVVVGLLCGGVGVGSAGAQDGVFPGVDPDWPVDRSGARDAWASGVDGSGVRVGVIDSQVVSDHPGLEGADVSYHLTPFVRNDGRRSGSCPDSLGGSMSSGGVKAGSPDPGFDKITGTDQGKETFGSHGTNSVLHIVGNGRHYDGKRGVLGTAPRAHVDFWPDAFIDESGCNDNNPLKAGDDSTIVNLSRGDALRGMVDGGDRIISVSAIGQLTLSEAAGYLRAVRHGVIVVNGRDNYAGTERLTAPVGYPGRKAYFPGVVTVANVGPDDRVSPDEADPGVVTAAPGRGILSLSDSGSRNIVLGDGGNSSATPTLAGYLALVVQRWPGATGNQVLQSLVHNTVEGGGSVRRDPQERRGYGVIDLPAMLRVDPSGYPDVNPVLEAQVRAARSIPELKDLYDAPYTGPLDVRRYKGLSYERNETTPLVGREYERQVAAWRRVEECRSRKDGGDCMRLGATATAGRADARAERELREQEEGWRRDTSSTAWVWWLAGGAAGVVLVVAGVVLAVVWRRRRRARPSGSGPSAPAPPVGPAGASSPFPGGGAGPGGPSPAGPGGVGPGAGGVAPPGPAGPGGPVWGGPASGRGV